jgi:glycosyltransferase involved in cell wall biosynthesis
MKFLIISHVRHKKHKDGLFAYEPYVREMNIWLKYVDKVEIVAPISNVKKSNIDAVYSHDKIKFNEIPEIEFTSVLKSLRSFFKMPIILFTIFKACKNADHIHLRCPGNIGLLGCFVQILFPEKIKTAKYAGNWDPNSKQPFSYRLQKWILRNTFLTKQIKVLVYGNWNDVSKNIVPFLTATYRETEKEDIASKDFNDKINLLFVGTLSKGKGPLLSVKVVNELRKLGYDVYLDIYGEGEEESKVKKFISENNLETYVALHGNRDKETIKLAYQKAHFLVFISKSEGWPKVVAEAMFWKCLPISTQVSCIPEMLGSGERGSVVRPHLDEIINEIAYYIKNQSVYIGKVQSAYDWSRIYTLDKFETEIAKLLHNK